MGKPEELVMLKDFKSGASGNDISCLQTAELNVQMHFAREERHALYLVA